MCQLTLILDAVRHGHELAVEAATDRGEETSRPAAVSWRQRREPGFDLLPGRPGRIEVGFRRLRRGAGDKRLVVIEPRPWPFVEHEVVQPRAPDLGRVMQQI